MMNSQVRHFCRTNWWRNLPCRANGAFITGYATPFPPETDCAGCDCVSFPTLNNARHKRTCAMNPPVNIYQCQWIIYFLPWQYLGYASKILSTCVLHFFFHLSISFRDVIRARRLMKMSKRISVETVSSIINMLELPKRVKSIFSGTIDIGSIHWVLRLPTKSSKGITVSRTKSCPIETVRKIAPSEK